MCWLRHQDLELNDYSYENENREAHVALHSDLISPNIDLQK